MTATLEPHVHRYVRQRVRRREICTATAGHQFAALMRFAEVFGARPLTRLGPADVERWSAARCELGPRTFRCHWSILSCFFDWLVEERLARSNPCRSMNAPRTCRSVPRALDEGAVAALLESAPDARARAIVWLMVGMGLRCVEVSRVRLEDWSRRDHVMTVTGKGGHSRQVPVPSEAARALNSYLAEYSASAGPLIRNYRHPNRGLTPHTISELVIRWMRDAGVKNAGYDGVSAHALRHTAASDVLEHCGDLRVVQEMLGHVRLETTSIYLRRAGLPAMRVAMEGRTYRCQNATKAPPEGEAMTA